MHSTAGQQDAIPQTRPSAQIEDASKAEQPRKKQKVSMLRHLSRQPLCLCSDPHALSLLSWIAPWSERGGLLKTPGHLILPCITPSQ